MPPSFLLIKSFYIRRKPWPVTAVMFEALIEKLLAARNYSLLYLRNKSE